MIYSQEVENMCPVAQGVNHGAAPIPEEAKWVKSKEVKDISGLTHGVGWCAPQQGACKLTLNVKEGIIPVSYTHLSTSTTSRPVQLSASSRSVVQEHPEPTTKPAARSTCIAG